MNHFLDTLNTVDAEELIRMSGMERSLAERIVAKRPFSALAELIQVEGMDEGQLHRLETAYLQQNPVSMQPAMTFAAPPPANLPAPAPAGPGFWDGVLKVLRFLARLLLILLGVAVLGVAIYFGAPFLYEKFMQPVQTNMAQLSLISTQQASDLAAVNGEVTDLKAQIQDLKSQLKALDARVGETESLIAGHTQAIQTLNEMQAVLDKNLAAQQSGLMSELDTQVKLMRALELLSRGRLYLSQSNFGTARQDVALAQQLLVELQPLIPAEKSSAYQQVLSRLDLALGNLPVYPVVAAVDVDIAWELLVNDLPASLTPASASTSFPSPTATPYFTSTATPTAVTP